MIRRETLYTDDEGRRATLTTDASGDFRIVRTDGISRFSCDWSRSPSHKLGPR